jgi:hypothetical protein
MGTAKLYRIKINKYKIAGIITTLNCTLALLQTTPLVATPRSLSHLVDCSSSPSV